MTNKKNCLKYNICSTGIFLVSLLLYSFTANAQSNPALNEAKILTQIVGNRTTAEWEPAVGTLIVYPLSIPYKLVVELAKDNHLFTLVENEKSKQEASEWFAKWDIDTARTTFIFAPQGVDAWWTRDWGPSAVFTPDKKMLLADGKYIFATPQTKMGCDDSLFFMRSIVDGSIYKTVIDDNATVPLAKGINMEVLDLPYITTGGNVITDGLGTAFSTCVLLNENKFYGVTRESFLKLNKNLLGFNNYHIISNFEEFGIQHIDCFMKLLDEETILVAEPPMDHKLYPVYENIIQKELKILKSVYGRPYKILRIKTGRYEEEHLAAYTNSIIINKTIYVPLFHIREDSMALKTWREVMPGYTVKGFEFDLKEEPVVSKEMREHYDSGYGWNGGDALHCRTRAIWDREMLFISARKIEDEVDATNKNIVYATIIDYSNKGLVPEKCTLFWRVKGQKKWNVSSLKQLSDSNHFKGEIPSLPSGKTIEYYISATSNSGRKETKPRTAPKGTYQFRIR